VSVCKVVGPRVETGGSQIWHEHRPLDHLTGDRIAAREASMPGSPIGLRMAFVRYGEISLAVELEEPGQMPGGWTPGCVNQTARWKAFSPYHASRAKIST
jgi:hypothetical protein